MKKVMLVSFIFTLIGCSQKDEKFCECLKIGEELNAFSNEILNKGANDTSSEKLKALKKNKENACQAYQKMDGEKMIELKSQCD